MIIHFYPISFKYLYLFLNSYRIKDQGLIYHPIKITKICQ